MIATDELWYVIDDVVFSADDDELGILNERERETIRDIVFARLQERASEFADADRAAAQVRFELDQLRAFAERWGTQALLRL